MKDLPEPISAYFAADRLDGEAVARCFARDAIVKDEGQTHVGLAAIRRWKNDTSARFSYRSEPFAWEQNDVITVIASRLTGDFPGSPVDLRFLFQLAHGKIASLEIIS